MTNYKKQIDKETYQNDTLKMTSEKWPVDKMTS